jgi:multidrug resistance protein, MATE family
MIVRQKPKEGGMAEMIAISLPMVVSSACDTVMVFTDRLFLARLDPELMNAVMAGGLASFVMGSFFVGLLGYTTALVAQHLGAGRKRDCAVVATQALFFAALAYPLILLARPLAYEGMARMGLPEEQLSAQILYLDILLYGSIFGLARTALSGFFSGIGRTRVVMVASFASMIANVGFSYLLVFGALGFPQMGIRGAAYATIISGALGFVILAVAYLSRRNRAEYDIGSSFRFDRVLAGKLLRFGSPTGAEIFLNVLAFNIMIMVFHSLGPVAATATTVVFNWDFVSFVPLMGIGIGVTSLVGRFMGAGRPDLAHRSTLAGLKLGLIYSFCIFVLFAGFPGPLVEVFRPIGHSPVFDEAAPTAIFMVRMAAVYVMSDTLLCIFISALRGAGDTRWAMFASVALHWMMLAALTVLLRVFHVSPETGWVAVVFFFLLFSSIVILRYRQGKWRSLRVVEPTIPAEVLSLAREG